MSTKIGNLSELKPHVSSQEKISEGVLGLVSQFNVTHLMKPLFSFKTSGINLKDILTVLILSRFRGLSIYAFNKSGLCRMDENTIYRMMNHPLMDWRGLLLKMATRFQQIVSTHGQAGDGTRCFVIDDTEIAKTGSTIEGISKVFSHVTRSYHLGFKMLVLALWDGKSLLPVDFSLHRESRKKSYGLTDKQQKKQFHKERSPDSPSWKRQQELDQEKTTVALDMLRRACRHSILAAYVLMDSWFVNDMMLQEIRRIRKGMLHVVELCKMDNRKFTVEGHELKSEAVIKQAGKRKGARHKSRIYKSEYIKVDALYKGMPVRLFYIRYRGAGDWKLLLTTDTSLSFAQAMKLYHIRWSIEVMFKECKQYLRLGQGQNTDFDGQIADATITLVTHVILSLQRRFHAYETMGGLFRLVQGQMIEDTLNERIMQMVLHIIEKLLDFLCIDVDLTIASLVRNDNTQDIVNLLNAVNEMRTINTKNKMVA